MENNKERDEAYRKSLNEVANLKAILKDLLGMDVNFIPKFKKEDTSHLQAEKDKERERLETQMFLAGLRRKDTLSKQKESLEEAQQRQDILSKGLQAINKKGEELSKEIKTATPKVIYRIIFRDRSVPPVTVTKGLYDNLITELELMNDLNNKSSYEVLMHVSDGDERLSIRQSDILTIVKV